MAIASGLSLRTIQRAEAEATASLQTLKALAAALDVDANDLKNTQSSKHDTINNTNYWRWSALLTGMVGLALIIGFTQKETLMAAIGFGDGAQEKILGRWAAEYENGMLIVTIDPDRLQAEGAIFGHSEYLLQEQTITYILRGEIQKSDVTFNKDGSMTWTRRDSGQRTLFKPIIDQEVADNIQGQWQSTDGRYDLSISNDRLVLRTKGGRSISSNYILDADGQIRFNGQGMSIERYHILMSSQDAMTWLRSPMQNDSWTFSRQKGG